MKKVTVGAVAVLFLLVGYGYASNPQLGQDHLITNMAGAFTSISLQIIYEQEQPPTSTLFEGQQLVTATSLIGRALSASEQKQLGYKREDDPVIYMWVDEIGNLSQINITWKNPSDPGGPKIWTINCRGGNQTVGTTGSGTPGLGLSGVPTIEDGTISTLTRISNSTKVTTSTETNTVRGVLACSICPDGFPYNNSTSPPTITGNTCNGGESYINGYLTFTGTFHYNLITETITSASITGTVAGGSFDYIGATWAATPCTTSSSDFECKAIFTGPFGATLTACPGGDPFCWASFP